jgi:hypothetical protein
MKLAARILSLIVLTAVACFYAGCDPGDDPEKSEMDQQIEKLNGTWNTTAYTLDGLVPADLDYSNFDLVLTGSEGDESLEFSAVGRPSGKPSPWPESGTVEFGTNVKQNLIRLDPNEVTVPISYSVTETTLIIDFTFSTTPYNGRVQNVTGNWHFEFSKQ